MGYVTPVLVRNSGRQVRHNELPHGSVRGDRSGREHWEHWTRRTIARASWCGSTVFEVFDLRATSIEAIIAVAAAVDVF